MNDNRVAGTAKQAEGTVKEATGKALGDAKLTAEGRGEKVEGATRKAAGGVKDVLRTWPVRQAPADTGK